MNHVHGGHTPLNIVLTLNPHMGIKDKQGDIPQGQFLMWTDPLLYSEVRERIGFALGIQQVLNEQNQPSEEAPTQGTQKGVAVDKIEDEHEEKLEKIATARECLKYYGLTPSNITTDEQIIEAAKSLRRLHLRQIDEESTPSLYEENLN